MNSDDEIAILKLNVRELQKNLKDAYMRIKKLREEVDKLKSER
jgi:hypothetical protein